jgi:hypothetical protein
MAPDAPSSSRPLAPEVPGVADLELVGRGGHGLVYRGHQPDLGRDVAVKLLSEPAPDERAAERWRREVTAMGRLSNHPNIVTILSEGLTDGGHPYLVMPFLPGGSLHDRIRADGPRPPAEVAEVGRRLALALAAAHAAGVVHRDVKPANVMFSEYDEPQLGDFGIARLADAATTATGSIHATLEYAAPEVLSGLPATPASDVYGLGATLHAALRGASPFAGPADEPLASRVGRVVTQPPPDLRLAGVPPALADVVERCMAKDPSDRPGSAEEVAALLAAASLDADAPGAGAATAGLAPPAVAPADPAPSSPTALDATAVQVPATPVVGGPAVRPAAAPPGPPPPRPPAAAGQRTAAPAAPGDRRRGRRLALAAALVVVFLAAAGLAWALAGDDDGSADDPTGSASATSGSEATSTTVPATTAASTTAASTEPPPSTTPTTAAPGPTAPGSADDARAAVEEYYARVGDGDAEGAWDLLSPAFRSRQTRDEYLAFWDSVESVELRGRPQADEGGTRVEATLEFRLDDGRTSVEDVVIGLVPGEDGGLLIDSYEVVRAR